MIMSECEDCGKPYMAGLPFKVINGRLLCARYISRPKISKDGIVYEGLKNGIDFNKE